MNRIYFKNGTVFGTNVELDPNGIDAPFCDITDSLLALSDYVFGKANRVSVYTLEAGHAVSGSSESIALLATMLELADSTQRRHADAVEQFNHLSEELAKVAAKLTETELALGRAHDVIENKQRHIEMLQSQADTERAKSLREQQIVLGSGMIVYGDERSISEVDRLQRRERNLSTSAVLALEKLDLAKHALTGVA